MTDTLRQAAQQALEALELLHPLTCHDRITALRAALAEQPADQEPVAWMSPGKERLEFSRKDTIYGSHTIPLYTAPQPKRLLTDEEIEAILYEGNRLNMVAFARAIERAHGIGA